VPRRGGGFRLALAGSSQELCSQLKAARIIHREHLNGRSADRSGPFDVRAAQLKVTVPFVATGMEERNELSGRRVNARQVGTLSEVTAVAGQRQVVIVVGSFVLFGDNMLDVMS